MPFGSLESKAGKDMRRRVGLGRGAEVQSHGGMMLSGDCEMLSTNRIQSLG